MGNVQCEKGERERERERERKKERKREREIEREREREKEVERESHDLRVVCLPGTTLQPSLSAANIGFHFVPGCAKGTNAWGRAI